MKSCKDDKRSGSLLKKRACRDKLEGEGEKVEDEKCTKLDPTWSWVRRSKGYGLENTKTCQRRPFGGYRE
jgi:hypothetical protein